MEMTSAQQLAVNLSGDSLLVSAAAGSGKTMVLSNRVIRKLTDSENGCLADSLMILTFTEAAAAEMRRRITKLLRQKAKEQKDNEFIRRQLMLLPAAKICTIHSACLGIIRNNFQILGLDPQFSIGEQNKLELMRAQALEDFVESLYERAQDEKDVMQVIDYFTRGREDSALSEAIDSTCQLLDKQPYPEQFVRFACDMTAEQSLAHVSDYLTSQLTDIVSRYDELIEKVSHFETLCVFYQDERDDIALTLTALSQGDWDKAYQLLSGYKFRTHIRRPKSANEQEWELAKNSRTLLKERTQELLQDYLYEGSAFMIADREQEKEIIKSLFGLCLEFNGLLFEKRRKMRMLSFDDIEKYALSLLIEKAEDGKIVKTALAKELSDGIDEIIVDEYQDCNRTQNLIFSALSKDEKNIFMVGDVKQSIYLFRGAEPHVFLQKQRAFCPVTEQTELTKPSRVDLSCNFRSHKKILHFVNSIFNSLMTKRCGGIDYSDGHELVPNPNAPESESAVELDVLLSGGTNKGATDKLSMTEAEAKFVADKIKELTQNGKIYDPESGGYRKVRAGDIAVLMRAPRSTGAVFERAFKNAGISYINNNPTENYLQSHEVRSVLAYLQVIDNPYSEIPLVTLMYSDFFGFTASELATIRAEGKRMPFYEAVLSYAKKDEKTKAFVDTLSYLRAMALTTDVYGIISAVYERSGILLRMSEKAEYAAAKANLMLLLDYAEGFEQDRYRGLFAFISYIVKLSERGDSIPAARLKSTGDCVSILSIHASKGLEYPIVFLTCAGNEMRKIGYTDICGDITYGAGGYIRDKERHRDFSSATRNLILSFSRSEELREYLRLLYVALTRPKNSLYITASLSVTELEKAVSSVYMTKGVPTDYDISEKPTFFKWLLYSLIKTQGAKSLCAYAGIPTELCENDDIAKITVTDTATLTKEEAADIEPCVTEKFDKERIKKLISRKYQFESDVSLPAKLSVSEIKNMQNGSEQKESAIKKGGFLKTPRFMQGKSGTDVGNATHHFLQFCNFDAVCDMPSLMLEKQRLVDFEFITEKESELVDYDKVLRFICSETLKRISDGAECIKEERFLFTLPAREITDTDSESDILIQGILDCLYIKDDGAVIVDYKTDRVENMQTLADRYGAQLDMYEKAVRRIKGIKVKAKYIYSFCLEQFIQV